MDINVKAKTVKLLIENLVESLCIIGIATGFLDNTSSMNHKIKNKLFFIKNIKNLCSSENTIKKMKVCCLLSCFSCCKVALLAWPF